MTTTSRSEALTEIKDKFMTKFGPEGKDIVESQIIKLSKKPKLRSTDIVVAESQIKKALFKSRNSSCGNSKLESLKALSGVQGPSPRAGQGAQSRHPSKSKTIDDVRHAMQQPLFANKIPDSQIFPASHSNSPSFDQGSLSPQKKGHLLQNLPGRRAETHLDAWGSIYKHDTAIFMQEQAVKQFQHRQRGNQYRQDLLQQVAEKNAKVKSSRQAEAVNDSEITKQVQRDHEKMLAIQRQRRRNLSQDYATDITTQCQERHQVRTQSLQEKRTSPHYQNDLVQVMDKVGQNRKANVKAELYAIKNTLFSQMKEKSEETKTYRVNSQQPRNGEMAGKLEQAYSQYRSSFNDRAYRAHNEAMLTKIHSSPVQQRKSIDADPKYTDFVVKRSIEETNEASARRNAHKEHLDYYKNQITVARNRDLEHRKQQNEQGDLWRQEQRRQREEDRTKLQQDRDTKSHMKQFYMDQMKHKEQKFLESCGLTENEARVNSHIVSPVKATNS